MQQRGGGRMNNQVLKNFFHGNLSPVDRQMVLGSDVASAVADLSDAENLLAQALPPELRPLMERVTKAQGKVDVIMAEASYIDGFKTGARLIMEILDEAHENLKPITE